MKKNDRDTTKNSRNPEATGVLFNNLFRLFLIQSQVNIYGASYNTTYNWVNQVITMRFSLSLVLLQEKNTHNPHSENKVLFRHLE